MEQIALTNLLCEPNIITGVLFIAISIPLFRGTIPMNEAYGFRIRKAFASKENWYAINRYGAKQMIIWSSTMIAAGIVLLWIPIHPVLKIAPLILGTTITIVKTLAFARTLPG